MSAPSSHSVSNSPPLGNIANLPERFVARMEKSKRDDVEGGFKRGEEFGIEGRRERRVTDEGFMM